MSSSSYNKTDDKDLKTPIMVVVVALVLALPGAIAMMSTRSGANFADAEQFTGNRLGAGSVDIGLDIAGGEGNGGPVDGTTQSLNDPDAVAGQQSSSDSQLFSATNLAPGDVATGSLAVNNAGSLPLNFWVVAAAVSSSATLDDWLLFDGWRSTNCASPSSPGTLDTTNVVLSPNFIPMIGRPPTPGQPPPTDGSVLTLQPGESVNVCLAARLPLAATNEVQSSVVDVELIVNAQQAFPPGTEETE